MGFALIGLVAACGAWAAFSMVRSGRVRPVVLMIAGSLAGWLLIRGLAPGLPGVHGAALAGLAVLWFLPFGGGAAAGGIAGWVTVQLRRAP